MSAMDQNSTPPPPLKLNYSFDHIMEVVVNSLNMFYVPLLVVLGCVGNIISIFVFIISKVRMQSTTVYLSALAVSDSIFLIQLIPPWLHAMQISDVFHRPGFCQIIVYNTYVSCSLSGWLVCAFTIERFVVVLHPLKRNTMCTMTRAKTLTYILVFAALVLNSPVLIFAAPTENYCNIDLEYMDHAARFNYVDTLTSFTVPLATIVILNAAITIRVWRLERARRVMTRAARAPQAAGRRRGLARPFPALPPRSQHRVTHMLLIVSSFFVLFNLPAYTMRLIAYAYDMSTDEYSGRWAALQQLALMFFNTNFGSNFYLYCLSGQNFRRMLAAVIPAFVRNRMRRNVVQRLAPANVVGASSATASYISATEAFPTIVAPELVPVIRARRCRHLSEPTTFPRWNYDVERAQPAESIEMADISLAEPVPDTTNLRCPQGQPHEAVPEYRRIPFLLFPFKKLMVRRSSDKDDSVTNH